MIAAHGPKLRVYSNGRVTPKVLRQYVEATRDQGYAFSQNMLATGVLAIGVTVPSEGSLTQLAVGVSAVAPHMSQGEQAQIAKTIRKII